MWGINPDIGQVAPLWRDQQSSSCSLAFSNEGEAYDAAIGISMHPLGALPPPPRLFQRTADSAQGETRRLRDEGCCDAANQRLLRVRPAH